MHDSYDPADIYLENNVVTASPQRLRLMLIEAAIRHATQAAELWRQGNIDGGLQSLTRAQAIVSELHSSVRSDESELAMQVAAIYVLLYSQLLEAQLETDVQRIEAVINVLHEERETWQQLCEKILADTEDLEPLLPEAKQRIDAPHEQTPIAPYCEMDLGETIGLSIEA